MIITRNCFLLLVSCVVFNFSFSQNVTKQKLNSAIEKNEIKTTSNSTIIDSLLQVISKENSDTVKIKLYLKLCDLCEMNDNLKYSNPIYKLTDNLLPITKDSIAIIRLLKWRYEALKFASYYYRSTNELLNEEEKLYKDHLTMTLKYHDYDGYSNTMITLSDYYFKQGKMLKKLKCLEEAYERLKSVSYYRGIARQLIQIAFFYADNKDTTSALTYINLAIENEKFIHDSSRMNRAFLIRGNLYRDLGQYSFAQEAYANAIKGYTHAKDTSALADVYRQIAYLFQKNKEFEKALEYFEKGEKIAQTCNDLGLMVQFLIGKGDALASLGKYDEAIKEHKWLWDKIALHLDGVDKTTIIFFGSHLAKDYVLAQQYKEAKSILDILSPITSVAVEKSNIENLAFRTDSALGNYKSALLHYINFIQIQVKLNDAEVAKAGVQQKFKADLEKQNAEYEKQTTVANLEKKKQQLILYGVVGALLLLSLLASVIFRNLRKTRLANKIIAEQKHLVEEKQQEILDSITYAKRLQEAILPPREFVNKHVPSNFILYKPKDIVAGDFYWAENSEDRFYIAAADSTGHGVPGALVSVVCSNALNRSVKEFKLTDTGKILDKTRELVIETFEKSKDEVKDGMDISLLCIDSKNKCIFWSGANNPLWYIQNGELKEISPNKQAIGKTDALKPFTTHQLDYKVNTTFYLFTDGFADQFGGPKGKKYKYKQFSDLLLSIHEQALDQQKNTIEQKFEAWKGLLEQVDDVCILGIKI